RRSPESYDWAPAGRAISCRAFLLQIVGGLQRQLQNKSGAVARAFTLGPQRTAHLAGRQRAGVQAEAVAVGFGGKPVSEDPGQVFRRQSHAAVLDRQADAALAQPADAEANHFLPLVTVALLHRLLGIAQQVQQNLEYLVLVRRDRRHRLGIAFYPNLVADQSRLDDSQSIVHHVAQLHIFHQAGHLRVALLGGHNLLDVTHVKREQLQLFQQVVALRMEVAAQFDQIGQHAPALRVPAEELRKVAGVLLQHANQSYQIVHPRLPNPARKQRSGYIHAVQDVAHVVQDAGGNLGHARLARECDEPLLRGGQFRVGAILGLDLFTKFAGAFEHALLQRLFGLLQRVRTRCLAMEAPSMSAKARRLSLSASPHSRSWTKSSNATIPHHSPATTTGTKIVERIRPSIKSRRGFSNRAGVTVTICPSFKSSTQRSAASPCQGKSSHPSGREAVAGSHSHRGKSRRPPSCVHISSTQARLAPAAWPTLSSTSPTILSRSPSLRNCLAAKLTLSRIWLRPRMVCAMSLKASARRSISSWLCTSARA